MIIHFQTWQDMKSKTKKKVTEIKRLSNLTGGGPPAPPLSEEESMILGTISEVTLVGHQDSQESLVEFVGKFYIDIVYLKKYVSLSYYVHEYHLTSYLSIYDRFVLYYTITTTGTIGWY